MSSEDDFDDNSPPDAFLTLLHTPIKDLSQTNPVASPYKTPKNDPIDTSTSKSNSVSPQKRSSSSSTVTPEKKIKLTPPRSPNYDSVTDTGDVNKTIGFKSKEPSPASKGTIDDWMVRPTKKTPSPSVQKDADPTKKTINSYFSPSPTIKTSNDMMPSLDNNSDSNDEKFIKTRNAPVKQDPFKTPTKNNNNTTVTVVDSDSDDDMIKFLQSNKIGPTAKQTVALNAANKKTAPAQKKATPPKPADDEYETVDVNAYSKVKPKSKAQIQQEVDKYKEEQEKQEHDMYIKDMQGMQFYEQSGNVVKPTKESKYTFTLETATPSKASRSGTITSFFPSKIVAVDSDEDEASNVNADTSSTTIMRSGLGFRLPSTFVNCSLNAEFKQLQEALEQEQKNYKNGKTDDGGGVCIAVLYRYDSTNFRRSKAEKKGEEEFSRLVDNMLGFVLLPSHSKKPFFVPVRCSSKSVKADPDDSQGGVTGDVKWQLLLDLMENEDIPKICYDAQEMLKAFFMKNSDLRPQHLYDPRVAAWIYEPELASYDYNELLAYYMKVTDKNSAVETNTHKCFQDMLNCFRLWTCLRSMLIKENLMEPFVQQEMRVVPILTKMELSGIGFDAAYLANKKKKLQQRIEELKREADKVLGHPIQLSSPQKISYALFNELGLGVYVSGKSNTKQKTHQSTSEKVLKSLKTKHALPGIILEFRHCQKLLSMYFEVLDRKAVPVNGMPRIHTGWEHTNTATGRLSSVNPNLQNLPKGALSFKVDEEGSDAEETFSINIRDAFCSQEGYSLVSFDYSQIEMRVLAHMSQDKYLLDFFRNGQDVHRLIASRWLNKPPEQVDNSERENAKRVVYGILYGMGPHSLSEIIGVSLGEASKFIQTFLGKFPSVNNFLGETIAFAKKNKHIKTLVNRRRLLPDINSFDQSAVRRSERQAVNSVIQGTAADIVKLAMIHVNDLIESGVLDAKECRLLLQIHDELFFEISNDNLYKVIGVINDTMEKVIKLDVELPVRVNLGTRWGSMKALDEKLYKETTPASTNNNNNQTNINVPAVKPVTAPKPANNNNQTKPNNSPTVKPATMSKSDSPTKPASPVRPALAKQNSNATQKTIIDLDKEYDINFLISSRDDNKLSHDEDEEDVACLLDLANHEDTD